MTNMTICHDECECCHPACMHCGQRGREETGERIIIGYQIGEDWESDSEWVCGVCFAREEAARIAREEAFEAARIAREARRAAGEVEEDIPF